MGLFDWLFGRGSSRGSSDPPNRADRGSDSVSPRNSEGGRPACPHCGARLKQTRSDGKCIACGKLLPVELRAAPHLAAATPGPPTSGRRKPPRPADVQTLGNSPMVVFNQGGMTVVMDCDAFDYMYGDADGPDPAQKDLDALLPKVTRICVLEGAMFRGRAMSGRVLMDTSDPLAIRDLAACLQIVEDPSTFNHCNCLGGPTMELYASAEHLATIGLQHGRAIRWKQWHHDAQLANGNSLTRWLHGQGVNPDQLQAIYQRGDNHLFADPEPASDQQKKARELQSQAQAQAEEGKLAEALAQCTQALDLDPHPADRHALRGQIHYHMGHMAEAVLDCTEAIDRGLRHAEVYFIRAVAHDGTGRSAQSLADCSMALHLNPEHAGAYNSRGLIRARLGQIEEALADLSEAIRLAPKWVLPHVHRAQCHHSRGKLDAALEDYNRAVEQIDPTALAGCAAAPDPMLAMLFCRRGDARFDQFQEEEAEADFDQARHCHPAVAAGYLGDMWLRRSKFELAKHAFAELIDLAPDDVRGYLGRGSACEVLDELEQADGDFSAVLARDPQSGATYALRARVRHRQGRRDDALSDLSEHIRLYPDDATGYLFRSMLHKERRESAKALEDLTAAHRVAPDNPHVCNNLAWMLATISDAHLRNGARAVTLARQACRITEWKNPLCLGTLAAALAETGAFEEAIRWQGEAMELYPEEEKQLGLARLETYRSGKPYREPATAMESRQSEFGPTDD